MCSCSCCRALPSTRRRPSCMCGRRSSSYNEDDLEDDPEARRTYQLTCPTQEQITLLPPRGKRAKTEESSSISYTHHVYVPSCTWPSSHAIASPPARLSLFLRRGRYASRNNAGAAELLTELDLEVAMAPVELPETSEIEIEIVRSEWSRRVSEAAPDVVRCAAAATAAAASKVGLWRSPSSMPTHTRRGRGKGKGGFHLVWTEEPEKVRSCYHFLLFLDERTWTSGEMSIGLAREVRASIMQTRPRTSPTHHHRRHTAAAQNPSAA
jgi:hypothetical protein